MQYSVVKFNDVKGIFRLDAEYFHPTALKYESIISQRHGKTLKEIGCKVVSGPFGSSLKSEAYLTNGIPFVRISDLKDFFISKDDLIYISEEDNKRLTSSQLKIGDLVLSKVGNTIGVVSKVTSEIGNCNISENNLGIRLPENLPDFYRDYILSHLNSKIGQIQVLRLISGNAQPKLNVSDIENLRLPVFLDVFYKVVSGLVTKAFNKIQSAHLFYSQAEQMLLSELNLLNWRPKHRLSFVRHYSNTKSALRIDAEYFQPMYEEIVESIISLKDYACLADLVSIKKCIEPGSEAYQKSGILFLRVSNLSKYGLKDGNQQYLSEELYRKIKQHQPKKGEILLSKDATPGIAYYLKDEPEKMIPSGGILRLTIEDEDRLYPEYLTLVLNSVIVQKQIERDAGGSVINHWRVDQVKNTLIPVLSVGIQKKIAKTVNASFCNRELSKKLLYIAKCGVELAIEKDEKQAQLWISTELKKLNIQ